jgi:hypothetical protein
MVAAASISFQSGDPPSLSGDGLIYSSTNRGNTWTPANVPNNAWSCVAASADGTSLVAAASLLRPFNAEGAFMSGDGLIYISTNSGASWYATCAPSDNWKSIACSADATRLLAAIDQSVNTNGGLFVSTNAGSTWAHTFSGFVNSVASSANGMRLVAADPSGGFGGCGPLYTFLYLSTNGGQAWASPNLGGAWKSVASSADGLTLVAVSDNSDWLDAGGSLSLDGGASWVGLSLRGDSWTAVACSADGRKLVVAGEDGQLTTLPYTGPWQTVNFPVPAAYWGAVTSSGDGKKLVATDWFQIYRSTNSGISWSKTSAPFQNCRSMLSSRDGTRLVATDDSTGYIYTSTNSGTTWAQASALQQVNALATSADCTRLVTCGGWGPLYTSTNFGATFIPSGPTNSWSAVASSADGIKLVAVSTLGLIYLSTNSGASWAPTSAPATNWTLVTSSADGTQLVAIGVYYYCPCPGQLVPCFDFRGVIYISRDSGASWSITTAPQENWDSVVSSADGTRLVAVTHDGLVYVSSDSGATWAVDIPANHWTLGTISADGSNIVALSDRGLAGILHWPLPTPASPGPPVLSMARSGACSLLSCLVPSTPFVLQQTSDLFIPNWVDVTNQPALNLTNLHNELKLSPSKGMAFYRLKRP